MTAMRIVSFTLGAALMAFGIVQLRRAAIVEQELRRHALEDVPVRRWPSQPATSYRPSGWPLLSRLRRTLLLAYVCGIIGLALIIHAF